ncbi:MAG TPA: hypothetical protein VER11_34465 [Polyangiaceae bacterium]|nr:hypothetical protein [Polyangiaceae bacterium]
MILGLNTLAIGTKPPSFKPWTSPNCLGWWDAVLSAQTLSGSEVLTAASLRNPADVLARNTTGPALTAASVGGRAAWVGDGTAKTLIQTSFAFPAISNSPLSVVFVYWVGKGIASATGFNTIWSAGSGTTPRCLLGFSGAGITCTNGVALTVTTGYTQGTPKRAVSLFSNQSTDRMQWGAATTTGASGASAAQSGFSILSRNAAASTFANAAWSCGGVFTAPSATAADQLIAKLDAYCSTLFTGWAGFVS